MAQVLQHEIFAEELDRCRLAVTSLALHSGVVPEFGAPLSPAALALLPHVLVLFHDAEAAQGANPHLALQNADPATVLEADIRCQFNLAGAMATIHLSELLDPEVATYLQQGGDPAAAGAWMAQASQALGQGLRARMVAIHESLGHNLVAQPPQAGAANNA